MNESSSGHYDRAIQLLAFGVVAAVGVIGLSLNNQAGRPWLHATLNIGQAPERAKSHTPGETPPRPGLTASGVFLVNPPHPLKAALQQALPALVEVLGRGRGQGQLVESAG
jgi:23S rRNA (adenine2030-N6)-methyltransferase